jgi:hypothetical protein
MATRYSGSLQINVTYDDRGHYRTSVSSGGKLLWRGAVNPAPVGFGPGVAYDSPQAYDKVASSAIAFANDEVDGIADKADYDEDLTGYLIKRAKGKTASSHAAKLKRNGGDAWIQRGRQPKKTEAQLKAEVDAVLSSSGGGGRSRR